MNLVLDLLYLFILTHCKYIKKNYVQIKLILQNKSNLLDYLKWMDWLNENWGLIGIFELTLIPS